MKPANAHWRRFQLGFADELGRCAAKAATAIVTLLVVHLFI